MNLQEFLLSEGKRFKNKKVYFDIPVEFKFIAGDSGERVLTASTPDGSDFVIKASIEDPERFKKWNNKTARADLQPVKGSFKIGKKKYHLARIRTSIEHEEKLKEKQEVIY